MCELRVVASRPPLGVAKHLADLENVAAAGRPTGASSHISGEGQRVRAARAWPAILVAKDFDFADHSPQPALNCRRLDPPARGET